MGRHGLRPRRERRRRLRRRGGNKRGFGLCGQWACQGSMERAAHREAEDGDDHEDQGQHVPGHTVQSLGVFLLGPQEHSA